MSQHNDWELAPDPKHQTNVQYFDNVTSSSSPPQELSEDDNGIKLAATRTIVPDSIKNLSPEDRAHAEKKLVRRLDRRLMPMILLMYIT